MGNITFLGLRCLTVIHDFDVHFAVHVSLNFLFDLSVIELGNEASVVFENVRAFGGLHALERFPKDAPGNLILVLILQYVHFATLRRTRVWQRRLIIIEVILPWFEERLSSLEHDGIFNGSSSNGQHLSGAPVSESNLVPDLLLVEGIVPHQVVQVLVDSNVLGLVVLLQG